ncbi:MAG: alpha-galactosidase, partial [Lachnospiraceae bacterium]|nr:alpha-galactosidase [Lachnospiraceae bacterium]
MIKKLENEKAYLLSTENTSYAFRVMTTGQIEHLYYGKKVSLSNVTAFSEKQLFAPGNSISYDNVHLSVSLENRMLEASFTGKGDIREPLVEAIL